MPRSPHDSNATQSWVLQQKLPFEGIPSKPTQCSPSKPVRHKMFYHRHCRGTVQLGPTSTFIDTDSSSRTWQKLLPFWLRSLFVRWQCLYPSDKASSCKPRQVFANNLNTSASSMAVATLLLCTQTVFHSEKHQTAPLGCNTQQAPTQCGTQACQWFTHSDPSTRIRTTGKPET